MSAIGGSDEHSSSPQDPETSSDYTSAETASDYDQSYEPEREFVLMPLFRRIGQMLGIRRSQEPEYVYEPEQGNPRQEPAVNNVEVQEQVVLPETAIQFCEPQLPAEERRPAIESAPAFEQQPSQELSHSPIEEDVLELDSDAQSIPSHILQESAAEIDGDDAQPIGAEVDEGVHAAPPISDAITDEPLVALHSEAPEMEPIPPVMEQWPVHSAQTINNPASRKRSQEEIRQLVAPLREAAVKITAIVAQAAEWLRAKEEEFLRGAEIVAPETKREQQNLPSSAQLESMAEDSSLGNTLDENEVPGLQRELAWHERSEGVVHNEPRPTPIQFVAKPDRPLSIPAVPFWKRINWADEFTPKRVAVLGGLAMAVLLVLGISLARRPASSVLPEPQARSIEPGGVTVTTHPVSAPVPPQVLRKTSTSDRPSRVPQHRVRSTASEAYDEPDVVVHHYDINKKPSPVKQTTVAGVRHYSDM